MGKRRRSHDTLRETKARVWLLVRWSRQNASVRLSDAVSLPPNLPWPSLKLQTYHGHPIHLTHTLHESPNGCTDWNDICVYCSKEPEMTFMCVAAKNLRRKHAPRKKGRATSGNHMHMHIHIRATTFLCIILYDKSYVCTLCDTHACTFTRDSGGGTSMEQASSPWLNSQSYRGGDGNQIGNHSSAW